MKTFIKWLWGLIKYIINNNAQQNIKLFTPFIEL